MKFKKRTFFSFKSCSRDFGAHGCHASSLIDLVNSALASGSSGKPTRMISEGYRTHRGVNGSMNFKKKTGFFFGKSCSRICGDPGWHPSTLIDLANTALASKSYGKTKSMITEGYRAHRGVTGPMNFKKNQDVFFSENRATGILGPLAAIQTF